MFSRVDLTKDDMKNIRTYYLKFYNDPEKYAQTQMVSLILMDLDKQPNENWTPKKVSGGGKKATAVDKVEESFKGSNDEAKTDIKVNLSEAALSACDDVVHMCCACISDYLDLDYFRAVVIASYICIHTDELTVTDKRFIFMLAIKCSQSTYRKALGNTNPNYHLYGLEVVYTGMLDRMLKGDTSQCSWEEFNNLMQSHVDYNGSVTSDGYIKCVDWVSTRDPCISDLQSNSQDETSYQKIVMQAILWGNYRGGVKCIDEFVEGLKRAKAGATWADDVVERIELTEEFFKYACAYVLPEKEEDVEYIEDSEQSGIGRLFRAAEGR